MKENVLYTFTEADSGGGVEGAHPPLYFCNHFEELQTELFEVELIINNSPLRYVCQNS